MSEPLVVNVLGGLAKKGAATVANCLLSTCQKRISERRQEREQQVLEAFYAQVACAVRCGGCEDVDQKIQQLLEEATASTIDLLLDGVRDMLDTIDSAANGYIAKLMADALVHGHPRGPVSRRIGRLLCDLTKPELDTLSALFSATRAAMERAGSGPKSVYVKQHDGTRTEIRVTVASSPAPVVVIHDIDSSAAIRAVLRHGLSCGQQGYYGSSGLAYGEGCSEMLSKLLVVFC